jgi:hypothetical protein
LKKITGGLKTHEKIKLAVAPPNNSNESGDEMLEAEEEEKVLQDEEIG